MAEPIGRANTTVEVVRRWARAIEQPTLHALRTIKWPKQITRRQDPTRARGPETVPILMNPRHERFAQELAVGKTADEAYGLAGFKPNRGNATRLKANESVMSRVEELQAKGAEKAEVTVQSLIVEAGDIQKQALAAEQYSAAVAAMTAKAKLAGHWVEKREDVTVRRTPEQIYARLAQILAAGNAGRSDGLGGRTRPEPEGDEAIPTVSGHGTA
jgi:phage terminase small subunit